MPAAYQGSQFRVSGDPIINLSPPPGVSAEQQRGSLDLLGHREPSLPADHQLARDAVRREGLRLLAEDDTPADVRAAIGRTLARFDAVRSAISRLEQALGHDDAAAQAIGDVKLSAFRQARSLNPKLLWPHLTPA